MAEQEISKTTFDSTEKDVKLSQLLTSIGNNINFIRSENTAIISSEDKKYTAVYQPARYAYCLDMLPKWKKAGLVKYNGEDFNEVVESLKSDLKNNSEFFVYSVEEINEYLNKRPQKVSYVDIDPNLSRLKRHRRMLDVERTIFESEYREIYEAYDEIEKIIQNAKPLKGSGVDSNELYLSERDSRLVSVHLNIINYMRTSILNVLNVYNKAKLNGDMQTVGRIEKEHNIPTINALLLFTIEHDLKEIKDPKGLFVLELENTEKFAENIQKLAQKTTFIQKEDVSFEYDSIGLLREFFVENPKFNQFIKKEEPMTLEEAKQFTSLVFDALQKMIDETHFSLGVDLELNFVKSINTMDALAAYVATEHNQNRIEISETKLNELVSTHPDKVIPMIVTSIFHEAGHAFDYFNNGAEFDEEYKPKTLQSLIGCRELSREDLFFIACVSPSFKDKLKGLKNNENIDKLISMINYNHYYDSKHETAARITSRDESKKLYANLAAHYKDDPVVMKKLEIWYNNADRYAETFYKMGYIESSEVIEGLTKDVYEDLRKPPKSLEDLNLLAKAFDPTIEKSIELREKAKQILDTYLSELSEIDVQNLYSRVLRTANLNLLDGMLKPCGLEIFSQEDLFELIKQVSHNYVQLNGAQKTQLQNIMGNLSRTQVNESKFEYAYNEILKNPNADMFAVLCSNRVYAPQNFDLHKYIEMKNSLPLSEKNKESYGLLIDSIIDRLEENEEQGAEYEEFIQHLEKEKQLFKERKAQTTEVELYQK